MLYPTLLVFIRGKHSAPCNRLICAVQPGRWKGSCRDPYWLSRVLFPASPSLLQSPGSIIPISLVGARLAWRTPPLPPATRRPALCHLQVKINRKLKPEQTQCLFWVFFSVFISWGMCVYQNSSRPLCRTDCICVILSSPLFVYLFICSHNISSKSLIRFWQSLNKFSSDLPQMHSSTQLWQNMSCHPEIALSVLCCRKQEDNLASAADFSLIHQ